MSGPCLCGDPYCPYCGTSDAKYGDECEDLGNMVYDLGLDETEMKYLKKAIPLFVKLMRRLKHEVKDEHERGMQEEWM